MPRLEDGHRHAPRNAVFHFGFSSSTVAGAWVTEVFSYADQSQTTDGIYFPPAFFARRALDNPAGQEQVQWTTVAACPALSGVIEEFRDYQPPLVSLPPRGHVPLGGRMSRRGVPFDASVYSLWSGARQADGAPAHIAVSASVGRLAEVVVWADTALSTCWGAEVPKAPPRAG